MESLRTHFEVLGLGLKASSPQKLPCSRLEDSTVFLNGKNFEDRQKNFFEDLFFPSFGDRLKKKFEDLFSSRAFAFVSLVLSLGLKNSCPWPRECLSSERLSLALVSDFFLCPSLTPALLEWIWQRWSRGHKARGQGQGQGHKKIRGQGQGQPFRGQTLSRPRTGMLEAKARNQGHKRKCSSKKKVFTKIFQAISKKKRSSQKFFKRSPQKNVFQIIFQALHKTLTIQKLVLSSKIVGQANFRGLEASRPRPRT